MAVSPNLGGTYLEEGQEQAEKTANDFFNRCEDFVALIIVDRDLTAAPSLTSPADDGKVYIVAGAPGGGDPWNGQGAKAAAFNNGWTFKTIKTGDVLRVLDEKVLLLWDGTVYRHIGGWDTQAGISAAGTTEGGATQLRSGLSIVTTITAASAEAVKLPAAAHGMRCFIKNRDAADALKVFPKSGDELDDVTTALSVPAGKSVECVAYDDVDWYSQLGA